ncbi:MAG: hypothetical protein FJW37_01675 [Acidobacteria bacterium]|nr:hypothetical protein [Acidobacteriota bacterium]
MRTSRVALVLSALLVALAAGEIFARLAGARPAEIKPRRFTAWAAPDAELGWVNAPGVHPSDEPPHAWMTVWPDGRRATAPAPGPAGAPAARELALVGCSFAYGYSLPDRQTLGWILQQHNPALAISNWASPGYGTYQALLRLERLLAGDRPPALVVYGLLPFHAERNVAAYPIVKALRTFGGERFAPPHVLLERERLVRYPPLSVREWPLERLSSMSALAHDAWLRLRLSGRGGQQVAVTARLMTEMAALTRGRKADFLVALLWDGGGSAPEVTGYAESLRAAGIDYLDCTYRGPIHDSRRLTVGGSGHPNEIVHQWWAGCIQQWVATQPPPSSLIPNSVDRQP